VLEALWQKAPGAKNRLQLMGAHEPLASKGIFVGFVSEMMWVGNYTTVYKHDTWREDANEFGIGFN
jgi:hypothetical protein